MSQPPYICTNKNISPVLQALNNYEGYDKFVTQHTEHTLNEFIELFHELTNNTFYILKVIPVTMHIFVQRNWFNEIDCKHDNSLFVIQGHHIFNYIFYDNVWWQVDGSTNECKQLDEFQLGLGTDYCLIPIRKNCADDFMKVLRSWNPIDKFYKEIQVELVMSLYNQKLERPVHYEDELE